MPNNNILVIDDMEKPRYYMVRKLRKNQLWSISSASSEQEAIEKLNNNKYDIVVADMVMENPDSGLKILNAAKKNDQSIEVIIITAHASVPNAKEAIRKGAFEYIEKDNKNPYELLYKTVEDAIKKKKHPHFDVFLSYNSKDVEKVTDIAVSLKDNGIYPWFAEWEILAGVDFQDKLEKAINDIDVAAFFIGDNGEGPWMKDEIKLYKMESKKRSLILIPVVLETTKKKISLPTFLIPYSYVDFRKTSPDPLDRLIKSIKPSK